MSIEVENESGREVDEAQLVAAARHALEALGVGPHAELAITLVGEERMTELHVQWMGLPGPTDVMAFPMDELDVRGARAAGRPVAPQGTAEEPVVLGDVVLCPAVAARQAEEAGHTTADELALLTTHGVLHLVGYDHAEPEEHAEMFGLQAELLSGWRGA